MISVVFPNSLLPKAFLLQLAVAITASKDSQHTRNVSHKLCLSFLGEQVKREEKTLSRYAITEEQIETQSSCFTSIVLNI